MTGGRGWAGGLVLDNDAGCRRGRLLAALSLNFWALHGLRLGGGRGPGGG